MSEQNIQKMQRDAEQRIREMQRRADRAVSGSDMPPAPFVRAGVQNAQTFKKDETKADCENKPREDKNPKSRHNSGLNFLKTLNFKNIKFDKDIMLIVVMILLLSSEETDEMLIFALIYIML